MGLQAGAQFGPYEILSPLGAGGMGEVYRARDTRLGRDVALKILPPDLAADPSRRRRFEQEARAVAALNHPNIMAVYDVGDDYMVSELVEGETLRITGPLPLRKTVDIAGQIADGLAAAHSRGIVHRDLKPENIMVTREGRVKILDFGLAKVQTQSLPGEADAAAATRTQEHVVMGSVGYISPEQLRGQAADARSDIFCFGAVLYEMLSGKRAYPGDSSIESMNAILKEEPRELPETLPMSLRQIVEHCLEKNPDARFQSARDLAFALHALSGSTQQVTPPVVVPAVEKRKSIMWPVAIAGIAALVASGVGFWGGRTLFARPLPTYSPLTFERGFVSGARFAPGGFTIAYSAAWEGNASDIYTERVESPTSRALGYAGARLFAVSSTGDLALGLDGKLAQVSLSGGTPRVLLSDVEDADWEPNGKRIAVAHSVNGTSRLEFPIGRVLFQTSGFVDGVRVSPQGDRIAFAQHPVRGDNRGSVSVVDLEGKVTTLSPGWEAIEGLAWAPDGKEIWFAAASKGHPNTVWAVTLSGTQRALLTTGSACALLDVYADGRILLNTVASHNEIINLAHDEPPERGSSKTGSSEINLAWLDTSQPADLSADGKTLLFTEQGVANNYAVILRKTDGSPIVHLGDGSAEALSPDGTWALANVLTNPPQLVLIPTGAGEIQHLPQIGLSYQRWARWFPDSRRILFEASEPGHGTRLWVQEVNPPGMPRAFTGEGTMIVGDSISPDGKTVAALGADGQLALYPVDGGLPRKVPGIGDDEQFVRWSVDGGQIFVHTTSHVPATLYKVDIQSGRKEKVRDFGPRDKSGVSSVDSVLLTRDGTAGVYAFRRSMSSLQMVDGAR